MTLRYDTIICIGFTEYHMQVSKTLSIDTSLYNFIKMRKVKSA